VGVAFSDETIEKLFGKEAAENENAERFMQYSVKGDYFASIYNNLSLRVIVGHKGSGKSALMRIANIEDKKRDVISIWLRPDDLVDWLESDEASFIKKIRNWKNGILGVVFRKALSQMGISASEDDVSAFFATQKTLADGLMQQANKLEKGNAIATEFKKSKKIKVYIDDIDRGWRGQKNDINNISALLNALRDISDDSLHFRIGLRTDVYYLVRTSDESTDKFQESVVWLSWTSHQILALLAKRIGSFFNDSSSEESYIRLTQADMSERYLSKVMSPTFSNWTRGRTAPIHRVLVSLIRKRPRDLVKLCVLAAKKAKERGNNVILDSDFRDVFEQYSRDRLQDTINEFRTELPSIEQLLTEMKPSSSDRTFQDMFLYSTDELITKIKNICEHGAMVFNGKTLKADPRELANFMYKINFLQARKELPDGSVDRKFFEENQLLGNQFADFGYHWEVHPAYRWALKPSSVLEIIDRISSEKVDHD
jgi:hypothetical protein